jgi:hypothetical protein
MTSDYAVSNERMISEDVIGTKWKEAIVAHFEVMPDICPG